jgi:gas vesicle protein
MQGNGEITMAQNSTGYFFAGLVIGGLTGAVVVLLLAPQSGAETREQIQQKTNELYGDATKAAGEAMEQVRQTSRRVSKKARDLVDEGRDFVSNIASEGEIEIPAA